MNDHSSTKRHQWNIYLTKVGKVDINVSFYSIFKNLWETQLVNLFFITLSLYWIIVEKNGNIKFYHHPTHSHYSYHKVTI